MSKMTPQEMAARIGGSLLSFPVTPFKADYSFDEATYRSNMDWLCGYDVAGLFAAGGTGEFFSLTAAEVPQVVAVAVDETRGRVPVLAGTGYGTAIAYFSPTRSRACATAARISSATRTASATSS